MESRASLYQQVGYTSEIDGATPHQLVQILMKKCCEYLENGKKSIIEKKYGDKQYYLVKAGDTVRYLRGCLNETEATAADLVKQLNELYDFIEYKILEANFQNNAQKIDEAFVVLKNIKEGWDGIAEKVS